MQIPSSSSAQPPRRFFTLRKLGFMLITFAALLTLIGLFYAEENWRGKHAWNNYRRDAEARGVELDFHKLIPPPVPDDQNFAMTPFLAPVLDFNPRPFTTLWRDTNGFNRTQSFAKDLVDQFKEPRPGQTSNLEALAAALQNKWRSANPSANISAKSDAAVFLLDYLNQYRPIIDEIRTASQRPYSRFNVHYEDKDPAAILLPHLRVLRLLDKALEIKASSELALGKTDSAFDDARLVFRLADSIHTEPIIVSQLVRFAILNSAKQIVWEGLAEHRWSDAQLKTFQASLGEISLLKDARMGLASERASFGMISYDLMRENGEYLRNAIDSPGAPDTEIVLLSVAPNGWLYQEQIDHQKLFDEKLLPAFNAEATQIQPHTLDKFSTEFPEGQSHAYRLLHHQVLARLLLPSLAIVCQKAAVCQANMEEALIACALERFRLANGKLPETLDALVPQYLAKVPLDVCTGQPMKYHTTDDGQFLLYSVGWNEKDDGGTVGMEQRETSGKDYLAIVANQDKTPGANIFQGDWVWPTYSQK